jgi:spectinomycin phosphotransferase
MFAEPVGFDREELSRTLKVGWGIEVAELRYEPVGFGTHHYRARAGDGREWFVNVDELAAKTWLGTSDPQVLGGLERTLGTAVALREAGLEFVHAPHRRVQGGCVAGMAGGYAVSLFSFIDGTSHPYGEFPTGRERRLVLAALGRMHAATGTMPPDLPRRDRLEVPQRQEMFEALRERTPWTGGPYAEPAQSLVRAGAGPVRDLFARYDALVPAVSSTSGEWVVTHGEPHAGNVMRTGDGGMKLIDWDTAALGPRERDLWMIEPRTDEDWAAYHGATRVDPAAMELYRLWWELSEICGYTATFRAPHADDGNTRIAWRELRSYLTRAGG